MYYINIIKKCLCGRNNQVPSMPLVVDYDTQDSIQFQFIDSQNKIQHLENTAGLYFAGGIKPGLQSSQLLFLSRDYTYENDVLTFTVDTYTENFLREIKKKNTEIAIEIGQTSLLDKKVLLRGFGLANPRVYLEGVAPTPIPSADYWTIEQTQEYVEIAISQALSSDWATEEYVDEAVSGLASETYVDNAVNGLASETYVDNAVSGLASKDYVDTSLEGYATEAFVETSLTPYATKTYVDSETSGLASKTYVDEKTSGYATKTYVDNGLSGKQDKIDASHKLSYTLISDTPIIPYKTSQLNNDSGFATSSYVDSKTSGYATKTYVDTSVSGKQDKIDSTHKLSYALLSDTPTIPDKTSQLNNDSGFVTSAYVDTKTFGYATESYVNTAVSGKQNVIDSSHKLAYSLLSGTPTIPSKTSDLTNDSNFATSGYVDTKTSGLASETYVTNAVSGKLDKTDYISPYCLPLTTAVASVWTGTTTKTWTNTTIIGNDKKIDVLVYTSPNNVLSFPTISSSVNETNVRTYELWVKVAGNESTGFTTIFVPTSYNVVNPDSFPTTLKGEDDTKSYTYHVFVLRFIPKTTTTYVTITYSHYFSSDENIIGG